MRLERRHAFNCTRIAAHERSGFTMIELLIVVCVVLLTLLLFSQTMGSAIALNSVNRESNLATEGARGMIEELQGGEDFSLLFRLYNDYPDDDPGGPGTAPGAGFEVEGLEPADDDPDGFVGEIRFPSTMGPGGLELHEDLIDEALGMPRDLDCDGSLDGADKKGTYCLLPVTVSLRWKWRTGVRTLEVATFLAER